MGKSPTILLFFVMFLFSIATASAQTLQEYNIDFHIAYNRVVVQKNMLFKTPVSGNVLLSLPEDAEGISLYVDDNLKEAVAENNQVNLELNSSTSIRLSYVTKELIDRSEFMAALRMPYDVGSMEVSLTLPEDTVLSRPLPQSDIAPSPAYPLPDEVTTDGRQIKLIWQYSGLEKGAEKSFFVRYKKEKGYLWLAALLALVIAALLGYIITRKPKIEKVVEKEDMLEKHLKEDEEQVVNILKQREGQCEQGTLRVITGFSKAKLSGLLKELEERNVIHKEKRGKKNLVFLRKL